MSDPSLEDLAVRLDDLLKEVRRQGRAAIAAQAAAESCLDALRAQAEEMQGDDLEDTVDPATAEADDGERWLRALIPVADAIERVAAEAAAFDLRRRPAPRGLLARWLAAARPLDAGVHGSLGRGLRVLQAQFEGALRDLGVSVDRATGGPVDGERQRVVEVRAPAPGERRGTVVEVVRPGYAIGDRILREAEVVVADADRAGGAGANGNRGASGARPPPEDRQGDPARRS
jgi:molecular chaperone GrpE (heat shock protein)